MDVLNRVPVREQEPQVRAANFEEVCLGYNEEEAKAEAARCLNCKNAQCMKGCPVSINIPAFIAQVKEGNFEEAYHIISQSSALPAVCGRVCPQDLLSFHLFVSNFWFNFTYKIFFNMLVYLCFHQIGRASCRERV